MFSLNRASDNRSGGSRNAGIRNGESGQAMIEYSLILGLLIFGAVATMAATGSALFDKLDQAQTVLAAVSNVEPAPKMTNLEREVDNLLKRIQAFYDQRGRWPRSWGEYAYTDIGLSPADYADPIDGVYIGPSGDKVSIGLKPGDKSVKVYVKDLDGNIRQLYSGWKIWCLAGGGCYYHTVAPGNEIDLSTLVVVDTTQAATR